MLYYFAHNNAVRQETGLMDFVFIIVLILILFVVPVMIRRARRPPEYSKFADHEINNPERKKVARCKKCKKTFVWKRNAWKESK